MTRREGPAGTRVLHEGEVLKVGTGAELIVAVGVAVVHEHPRILVDELEHTCTLYGLSGLLERAGRRRPLAAQRLSGTSGEITCGDLADATLALVLIEAVVEGVRLVVDDVHVDGGRAAVVEVGGLAIEVGEVGIGIAVVVLIVRNAVASLRAQREINHEALCLVVPDGLGCPDADDLLEQRAAILRREMNRGVLPMDKVGRFHHD